MSRAAIARLMDEMTPQELSDLHQQIQLQLEGADQHLSVRNDTRRTVNYRYKAKLGTVTPSSMKKVLFQTHSSCVLGVSLGSANSEGDRFEGSIRWIAQNFSRCILVVADSIYRHTLQITEHIAPEEGCVEALKLGADFIAEHRAIVDQYRDECEFEWRCMSQIEQHPEFSCYHQAYHDLYEHDGHVQAAINDEAHKYLAGLSRDAGSTGSLSTEQSVAVSAKYLLEESAIFTCLCEQGEPVFVYPGTIKPLLIFSQYDGAGVPEPIRKLVMVRLNLSTKNVYFSADPGPLAEEALLPAHACSVLGDLSDEHWAHIQQHAEHRRFQAGDVLVPKGRTNRALTILLKGHAEVLEGDWNSGEVKRTLACGPVSMFGERSFLEGEPATKTLAALTDGELLELSAYSLKKMKKKVPSTVTHLLSDIARVLAVRIDQARA